MKKYAIALLIGLALLATRPKDAAADAVGAAIGASVGTAVAFPVGTIVGAVIGGVFGSPWWGPADPAHKCWIDNNFHRHCPAVPAN